MREAEPIPGGPVLLNELVHPDLGQIAGDVRINIELVLQSWDRHDVEIEAKLSNLFNWDRNSPFFVVLFKKRCCDSSEFVVGQEGRYDGHGHDLRILSTRSSSLSGE